MFTAPLLVTVRILSTWENSVNLYLFNFSSRKINLKRSYKNIKMMYNLANPIQWQGSLFDFERKGFFFWQGSRFGAKSKAALSFLWRWLCSHKTN